MSTEAMDNSHEFKPLRLAHGTLRIRIDETADRDMLVDREVILAHCPTLEPMLRNPDSADSHAWWDRSDVYHVPDLTTGELKSLRVWSLALNCVEDTYILEGQNLVSNLELEPGSCWWPKKRIPFVASDLAEPGWQRSGIIYDVCPSDRDDILNEAAFLHHILFRVLHGFPVAFQDLEASVGIVEVNEESEWKTIYNRTQSHNGVRTMRWVYKFCSLAEYYGCLEKVANHAVDWLIEQSALAYCVALDPTMYLTLAAKLHWQDLYFDAVRHQMVRADESSGTVWLREIAEGLEISDEDMLARQKVAMAEQEKTVATLSARLRALQLSSSYKTSQNGPHEVAVRTTLTNKNETRTNPLTAAGKASKRAGYIARTIYGEWLSQQEVGELVWIHKQKRFQERRSHQAGPLSRGVAEIQEHSLSADPSLLFGESAVEDALDLLGVDSSAESIAAVKTALNEIVHHANDIIQEILRHHTEKKEDGTVITHRRTCWGRGMPEYLDWSNSSFTYLGLDEGEVPWKFDKKWNCSLEVAPRSGTAASPRLLRALGFYKCRNLVDPGENPYEDSVLRSLFGDEGEDGRAGINSL
ncbi:hypothetical protein TI39_contig4202g00062 [Zymoseptoria brevis]|uniref:Uncharacterized protein n=1 Tax=Zymoseptoria brevis TaxID=1047168 RepID=A0A0F4GAD0_9PEZI|nr:hypothetical protein TI39_contig4202g00062 [Zymoseptoria brevis]